LDYAVFIGEEKTLIYKRDCGIVLNEPSLVATQDGKVISVGKNALQYLESQEVVFKQITRHGNLINTDYASIFIAAMLKKVGTMCDCLVCIPSSLDASALNDYKTAFYTAGVADATFIPTAAANAFHYNFDFSKKSEFLSVIIDGESADMVLLRGAEIVDGGCLYDLSKFDEALNQIQSKYPSIERHLGDRMSITNGAGKLLLNPMLVRKIVDAN
jgi:actin-like ATPase involved in cell morphogenesis